MKRFKKLLMLSIFVLAGSFYMTIHVQAAPNQGNQLTTSGEIATFDPETDSETDQVIREKFGFNQETNEDVFIPKQIPVERSARKILNKKDTRIRITNTTAFPNSAIGQIRVRFPNNKIVIGTAWLFGNKVAITAGHCLYSKADGGWAKSVIFYPGKNGNNTPFGSYTAKRFFVDKNYINQNSTVYNSNFDWGMLRFDQNVGKKCGYFGAKSLNKNQIGQVVTVRGYPGEKQNQLWTANGTVTGFNKRLLCYKVDITPGQSGSPVYQSDYRAVAIHTSSPTNRPYNQGQHLDQSLIKIFVEARKW